MQPALEPRPEERSVREQWQVIYLGEDRIGYASSREQKVQRDKQTIIQTRSEMHMTVKRFGQELKMTTLLEIVAPPTPVLLPAPPLPPKL